nr:TetM/TetW/TetO/TetS family tetracycline resistance ribosomal protection protein [Eubacterium sp.]
MSKRITAGIVAHVDSGKTTLSEAMLYTCGEIRKLGRVDHQDAFLDTSPLERERGITIFSKQARMNFGELEITLLDTPGHVDFSTEMERTLRVLDYAILVISGTDGVQGHTETLWRLLESYGVPVFLFVNKMDLAGADQEARMREIQRRLSDRCVDFSNPDSEIFFENVAMCDEVLLEKYLEDGTLNLPEDLREPIWERKLFPCFFGSALRLEGVKELLEHLEAYTMQQPYSEVFGAKVYKISRDEQGKRLTHMKVTGGEIGVRAQVNETEKINQIRLYSGDKYEVAEKATAGMVCAVTGLEASFPGQGLGAENDFLSSELEPVLNYGIEFSEGTDVVVALQKLRELEEEDPQLHIIWNEKLQRVFIQPMGEVQLEVLKCIIKDRFGMEVSFGEGTITYRETIGSVVEGVGHFEPLRHYAEAHLILEPLPLGSGLVLETDCSEDKLDLNWQRLILTHLAEREFPGVLTGSAITDMKITLVAGRAHLKHTEGGDFRQATYRAVRQGLMQAESILLEPVYRFRLEVPAAFIGRAMTDIKRMSGDFETLPEEGEFAVLTGTCPVLTMKDYPVEFAAYSKGRGHLSCVFGGYAPCHNTDEVVLAMGYDPEADVENTPDSVFCSHGSGYVVKWNLVFDHMHVPSVLVEREKAKKMHAEPAVAYEREKKMYYAEEKELQAIFERTFGPVKRHKEQGGAKVIKGKPEKQHVEITFKEPMEEYLLVDGYNIIFAWEELKELTKVSLDAARMRLQDILCNYQGYKKCHLIVVFDAYKVKGNPGSVEDYHNISVVYTKEAETADMYIEKTTKKIAKRNRVRVATSDGMEQMIILGHGATRVSARAFQKEVEQVEARIRQELQEQEESV